MFPWLWFWTPQLYFPWSGSVAQRIEPNWFFDAISPNAGIGKIEKKAFEIASYGRQLGLITEVVLDLAKGKSSEALSRLKSIYVDIECLKQREFTISARTIEDQMDLLKKHSRSEYDLLIKRLKIEMKSNSASQDGKS